MSYFRRIPPNSQAANSVNTPISSNTANHLQNRNMDNIKSGSRDRIKRQSNSRRQRHSNYYRKDRKQQDRDLHSKGGEKRDTSRKGDAFKHISHFERKGKLLPDSNSIP